MAWRECVMEIHDHPWELPEARGDR